MRRVGTTSALLSLSLSLSLPLSQTDTHTDRRSCTIHHDSHTAAAPTAAEDSIIAECRMPITTHLSPRSVPLLLSSSLLSLLSLLLSVSTRFRILCCRCSTPTLYVVCCHHPRSTVCCNQSHSLHMTTDTCEMQYLPDACTIIVRSMFSNPTYATLPERGKGCDATELRLLSCLCECQCVCCLHVWPSHPYGHGPSELCLYLADIVGGTTGANS